jgi:hypothetical protein
MPSPRSDALRSALEALSGLERLGEGVEDDWQYVVDLARAWRAKVEVAAESPDDPLTEARARAVEVGAAEAAAISDPHRAIDWLSTFPQLILLAIGQD